MARYDVVLLDADRTLLDFERSERAALRRALAKWGLPQDDQVCDTYSKINDALWASFARGEIDQDFLVVERFAALLRLYGAPDSPEPARLNRDYAEFLGQEAFLLPGADGFCRTLGEMGLTLAIATNGLPGPQRGRYVRTGLNKLVPNLFISMEVGAQKPQREFFDRVLEALGVSDRSRTVMVGDGLGTDILGADRAGIDSIWYDPGGAGLTGSVIPTWRAGSYEEILEIIRGG